MLHKVWAVCNKRTMDTVLRIINIETMTTASESECLSGCNDVRPSAAQRSVVHYLSIINCKIIIFLKIVISKINM